MATCDCCGCVFESDYGTSEVTGAGSASDPYVLSMDDPSWQRPAARIRRSTSVSITPSGTFNAITFTEEIFDTGGFWVIGSPTRLTIPVTGQYIFGGCAGFWAANAVGTREIAFRSNGTTVLHTCDQPVAPLNGGSVAPASHITYQAGLNAGDYLELLVRQESGGALTLDPSGNGSAIVAWIFYAGKRV